MKWTPQNTEDIKRYYKDSILRFDGNKILKLTAVDTEELTLIDKNGNEEFIYLNEDYPFEFNTNLPHKSIFAYKKTVAYLYRIPARQYKRGICGDNCKFLVYELGSLSWKGTIDTWGLVEAYTDKQDWVPLSLAVKNATSKGVISAVTNRFSVAPNYIYCDNVMIGVVDSPSSITVKSLFKPEFMALNINNDITIH